MQSAKVTDGHKEISSRCWLASSLCRTLKDKPVIILFAADAAIKTVDVHRTESNYEWGLKHPCSAGLPGLCCLTEHDPIARPLVGHPAAFYSAEYAYAGVSAWLGHKMRTSRHRWAGDIWWVPQTFSFGGNLYGYLYSRSHSHAAH